jgi:transcription-repair coupling factor (superfamily II helicase)
MTWVSTLPELVPILRRQTGFSEVLAALHRGEAATIDGAWGSACALAGAVLAQEVASTLVLVLPRLSEIDEFAGDLAGFLAEELNGKAPEIFPGWEALPREGEAKDSVFGTRLRVLRALRKGQTKVLVTCLPALLQPVPTVEEISAATRILHLSESIDPDDLLRWLVSQGCDRVPVIELPGEVAMHGGILDVFPPDATDPYRIEFFGDEIESIRRFDAATQKKLEDLKQIELTFLSPRIDVADATKSWLGGGHFVDALPEDSWIALVELSEMLEEGRHYLGRLDNPRGFYSVDATLKRCTERPTISIAAIAGASFEASCHLRIESIERFTGAGNQALTELAGVIGEEERVLLACHNAGEKQRLKELLAETPLSRKTEKKIANKGRKSDAEVGAPASGVVPPAAPGFLVERVGLCEGYVARGFRLVSERLVVLSDHELFSRRDIRRTVKKRSLESRAIDSFLELNESDLVVHLSHGIARYRGMKLMHKDEQTEEHLALEFRDKVIVYVPVSLIHLVQKYVGGGASGGILLSKLGGSSWERKKQAVADALMDLASEMLQLQAQRALKPGNTYPPDSHWQEEFEAAFPYQETDDQLRAISDLKHDMERPQPMDRLICGDVGYGKTEVAMRAAFKALDNGKQVAILVPTTVLAEQHFRSFSERMAEFPFTIEVLSRFRTAKESKQVLEGLRGGSVDLVVGTHRLVQKDIAFKDLGLLVIDEEQRFGVDVKERLKKLRLEVEVLTLSATPIPRTLHLSLLGIRDISNLTTPPHDRLAIETRICRFDESLIRQAIVRELNRGGQIYFVHNRVHDIEFIANRLQAIVPEATIGIVHGQLSEGPLEETMYNFVRGAIDILVATTIIESGLDIPMANTIFIHQAENYGLADLHQLRGRVGRYKHRAYCYLLLEEGKSLTGTAAKRLKAIEEFSELGAGFKIAMRDLEIRGAGNILGTEQSGHIASIGYELYCQLLENAVRQIKKEPLREVRHVSIDLPISAFLPGSFIPPGRPKIEVYRRISQIASLEELHDFINELRDRFGQIPHEAELLFELKELQLLAHTWQIDDIHLEEKFAVFGYRNGHRIRELGLLLGSKLRIVDQKHAYYLLDDPTLPPEQMVSVLKGLLSSHLTQKLLLPPADRD